MGALFRKNRGLLKGPFEGRGGAPIYGPSLLRGVRGFTRAGDCRSGHEKNKGHQNIVLRYDGNVDGEKTITRFACVT